MADSGEMGPSCEAARHSRISQHFMGPEISFPCSQEHSTGPYPEPDQSTPYNQSYLRYSLILSIHLCLRLPSGLFPSGLHINIHHALLDSLSVLHSLPISSSVAVCTSFRYASGTLSPDRIPNKPRRFDSCICFRPHEEPYRPPRPVAGIALLYNY
jgi:hypothetical protein